MSVWSFDYNSVSAAGSDCDAGSVRCVIANVEGEAFVVAFPDRIIAIRQNADPEHAGAAGRQIFKLGGRTVVILHLVWRCAIPRADRKGGTGDGFIA